MHPLPKRHILPIKPKEYLRQGLSHCGAFSTKAILNAFGKDDKHHPKEYFSGLFGRATGITFTPTFWVKTMNAYGISSELKSNAHGDIYALKKILASDNPVMLTIGNGYTSNGSYSRLKAHLVGHWITLWGYDDAKQVFYVYDSCIPLERHTKDIPIGNTTRTYDQIRRDWKGAWFRNLFGWKPYMYLEVHNP